METSHISLFSHLLQENNWYHGWRTSLKNTQDRTLRELLAAIESLKTEDYINFLEVNVLSYDQQRSLYKSPEYCDLPTKQQFKLIKTKIEHLAKMSRYFKDSANEIWNQPMAATNRPAKDIWLSWSLATNFPSQF